MSSLSIADALRIAKLVPLRQNLLEWVETFEDHASSRSPTDLEKYPSVRFEEIGRYNSLTGEGHGWDGDIVLDVDIAIMMVRAALAGVERELTALGVRVDGET